MEVSSFFGPLSAFAITLAAMQAGVALNGFIRRRDYRRFENQSEKAIAEKFRIPDSHAGVVKEHYRLLGRMVGAVHQTANAEQTAYYNAVVRSASCLVLAFLSSAVSSTQTEFLLPSMGSWAPALASVSSWVDVVAIGSVLFLYLYGREKSLPWITHRAGTEFMRQFQTLSILFPSIFLKENASNPTVAFETEYASVVKMVQEGPAESIVQRVNSYWAGRRAQIASHAIQNDDLTLAPVLIYLEKRVRRQLGWFTDSAARLEHIATRRKHLLISLYCASAVVALIKHVLFLSGYACEYLQAPLLILTGVSAAMTVSYLNQNSRSLIRRYDGQIRSIEDWIVGFKVNSRIATLSSFAGEQTRREIRSEILEFEDLMIDELVDWINITRHDAIELG